MAIQLKISLIDIAPEIWRRVVVPATLTFGELHAVIQGAMGWQDYHLHSFDIGGRRFEMPLEDEIPSLEKGSENERLHTLDGVLSQDQEFLYAYDFGDDWGHLVVVEAMDANAGRARKPRCVAGARACPPEDCGGPYGYPEFLDALEDEGHPDHEDAVAWIGAFDPEDFDVEAANRRIDKMIAIYRRRGWGFSPKAR